MIMMTATLRFSGKPMNSNEKGRNPKDFGL